MSDPSPSDLIRRTTAAFREKFGQEPEVTTVAPGRVEVLGNHTDYNGGYVLSAAIDKRTCVAASKAGDATLEVAALDMDQETATTHLPEIAPDDAHKWASYVFGVAHEVSRLPSAPKLGGARFEIHSDVPLGAGLSSSAALEVGTALAIQGLYAFEIDPMELARLCQRAENHYVGVSSGLMDQFSSVFGKKENLLFLDCRSYEYEAVPMSGHPVKLVVCNSMVKHALTGGEYNSRRKECEAAAKALGHDLLRDATMQELDAAKDRLSENEYKRAKHVIGENERVLKARDAAKSGDMTTLGRLMSESHASSRDNFENSTKELDRLVEIAQSLPGCYGSRLTGGGFGGANLSLVDASQADEFSHELAARYGKSIGKEPDVFVCEIADGAARVPIS